MDDQTKKLELKITQLEEEVKKLQSIRRSFSDEELKIHHEVDTAIRTCGINECKPCTSLCVHCSTATCFHCSTCTHCSTSIGGFHCNTCTHCSTSMGGFHCNTCTHCSTSTCDVECSCGPCAQCVGGIGGGGGGRFGGLG